MENGNMSHKEYADSLRLIADFFEQHPEIELPHDHKEFNYFSACSKDRVSVLAKALGECLKVYDRAYDGSFELCHHFGQIEFRVISNKGDVCQRRIVGSRQVEAKVIPATIIPAHEEEIVEWDCAEPLLGGTNGKR